MADRIEREIEEILAKLDGQLPPEAAPLLDRQPVSIASARKKRKQSTRPSLSSLAQRVDPPMLMFAGAGTMIGGLILASFAGPLIWLSFAGVVLFLGAFGLSFLRSSAPGQSPRAPQPQGKFWRDRYIDVAPPSQNPVSRMKRRFRK